jgi:hypothetical protein
MKMNILELYDYHDYTLLRLTESFYAVSLFLQYPSSFSTSLPLLLMPCFMPCDSATKKNVGNETVNLAPDSA